MDSHEKLFRTANQPAVIQTDFPTKFSAIFSALASAQLETIFPTNRPADAATVFPACCSSNDHSNQAADKSTF